MDRSDLELVVAVARTGSLTGAARALHIAQPALSRRLAALEHAIGAELFQRGRHGATPTVVGRALLDRASLALEAIDRAEQDAADAAAGRAGRLLVGVIPTLGAVLLPPVLATFRASHPSVRLELIASGNSANLRQRVATGELDLAITVLPASVEPGVRVAATGAQRFVVVAPEDLRLGAKQGKLDRRRLVGVPVVTLAAGEGLRQQLDAIYRELGSEPEISIETTEREMLVPLVAAGLGITMVPEGFARQRSVTGLRIYDLVPPVERSFGAFVADTDVPTLVSAFIAALVGSGELRASGARRSRRPSRAR